MYNWSVDETKLKRDPEAYEIWRLEQAVNYGLNGEKLNRASLQKYFEKLFIEDSYRREFLNMLLWEKKS